MLNWIYRHVSFVMVTVTSLAAINGLSLDMAIPGRAPSLSAGGASLTSLDGVVPPLRLYNSLRNKVEPFATLKNDEVSMYTCGPTVYAPAHLGNFRAFLTYDVVKRVLSALYGLKVQHICNLTDIDDKIINECRENGIPDIKILTEKYTKVFMDDLSDLNIVPANDYPLATQYIDEIVAMVKDLEAKGYAYQDEDGWWFDVSKKEGYGKQLVQLADAGKGMPGTGIEGGGEGKRDFALWKAYKPGIDVPTGTWETVLGKGRPGWHIECSAIAKKTLGDQIDLHCGGVDLKFPHHENEIAQNEGVSGKQFCGCWLHNGFVNIGKDDEKMSKSLGNYLVLQGECPKELDKRAFRYLVVSSHYRSSLAYTKDAVKAAKGAVSRVDKLMKEIENIDTTGTNDSQGACEEGEMIAICNREREKFIEALADDLSTPRAAASLFGVVKAGEKELKRYKREVEDAKDKGTEGTVTPLDVVGLSRVQETILAFDEVFGIFYNVQIREGAEQQDEVDEATVSEIPNEVKELAEMRAEAKKEKDWAKADECRDKIAELGFAVKDVKGGGVEFTKLN